jgi:NAD(P)H-hydrate repair Nnr-like enzyme with NAD(P)H-hydrate dehydratase domain
MKRILLSFAIGAVVVLAGATTVRAEIVTNTTVSYAYSGWVPCANGGTGELMTGTIDAHILEASTSSGSQLSFNAHGTLVGSITGDAYKLVALTRGTYVTTPESDHEAGTYVNRYGLIGPGRDNNLVVRETAHWTRNGDDVVVDHDSFSIECG